MRLRRPTAGERKEGEGGGKMRGRKGGTVCGSLGSGRLPKIVCVCAFTQRVSPQPMLPYLRSWCQPKHLLGKFEIWAPFRTFPLRLMLQFHNYVFSLQLQFNKKRAWLSKPKTALFSAPYSFLQAVTDPSCCASSSIQSVIHLFFKPAVRQRPNLKHSSRSKAKCSLLRPQQ